jgi:(heptosyl)LPS beta-1,4-glucosyltransferase
MKLTILILTKNEEHKIEKCLKQCDFADEIVVLDSCSTDTTREIAAKYTNKIYERPFTNFLEQRLFGIEKTENEWVLMVDADEGISEGLKREVNEMINQDECHALDIPRRNYLNEKWIKHCNWYPDYQTRLFKKETMTHNDELIHTRFGTTKKTKILPKETDAYFNHEPYESMSNYIERINKYTEKDAEYYANKDVLKITPWGIFTRSMGMMTQTLFHHKGYKDGMEGFIIAGINFIYSFLMMVKIWEINRQ